MSIILMEQGFKLGAIKRRISAKLPSRSVAEYLGISSQSFRTFHTIVLTDKSDMLLEWVQIALRSKEKSPLAVFDLQTGTAWTTEIVWRDYRICRQPLLLLLCVL